MRWRSVTDSCALHSSRGMCFIVLFFDEGCIANGDQDQALEEDRRPSRVTEAPSYGCWAAVDGRQEKQHKVRMSTSSHFPLSTDTACRGLETTSALTSRSFFVNNVCVNKQVQQLWHSRRHRHRCQSRTRWPRALQPQALFQSRRQRRHVEGAPVQLISNKCRKRESMHVMVMDSPMIAHSSVNYSFFDR